MHEPIITLYGIRSCDTVRKARQWLSDHDLEYQFHDFKLQGVPPVQLDQWLAAVSWETLVNRQGNTWRKLDEAAKTSVVDAPGARAVMLANPSVIKRPVVEWMKPSTGRLTVGFKPEIWASLIA